MKRLILLLLLGVVLWFLFFFKFTPQQHLSLLNHTLVINAQHSYVFVDGEGVLRVRMCGLKVKPKRSVSVVFLKPLPPDVKAGVFHTVIAAAKRHGLRFNNKVSENSFVVVIGDLVSDEVLKFMNYSDVTVLFVGDYRHRLYKGGVKRFYAEQYFPKFVGLERSVLSFINSSNLDEVLSYARFVGKCVQCEVRDRGWCDLALKPRQHLYVKVGNYTKAFVVRRGRVFFDVDNVLFTWKAQHFLILNASPHSVLEVYNGSDVVWARNFSVNASYDVSFPPGDYVAVVKSEGEVVAAQRFSVNDVQAVLERVFGNLFIIRLKHYDALRDSAVVFVDNESVGKLEVRNGVLAFRAERALPHDIDVVFHDKHFYIHYEPKSDTLVMQYLRYGVVAVLFWFVTVIVINKFKKEKVYVRVNKKWEEGSVRITERDVLDVFKSKTRKQLPLKFEEVLSGVEEKKGVVLDEVAFLFFLYHLAQKGVLVYYDEYWQLSSTEEEIRFNVLKRKLYDLFVRLGVEFEDKDGYFEVEGMMFPYRLHFPNNKPAYFIEEYVRFSIDTLLTFLRPNVHLLKGKVVLDKLLGRGGGTR